MFVPDPYAADHGCANCGQPYGNHGHSYGGTLCPTGMSTFFPILNITAPQPEAPTVPGPVIPPECWRVKPTIDNTDYMGAVRAMCGDTK